ncbi:tetratricopeptide repeat protein [Desulfoplanes sp.]
MQDKIKVYEEMLALEPRSKLFFPLGKMLVATGEFTRAKEVILQGLGAHPEYLEARLLLVEVLSRLDDRKALMDETRRIVDVLAGYTGFWKEWDGLLAAEGERDTRIGLRFVHGYLQGTPLAWGDVLERGCAQLVPQDQDSSFGTEEAATPDGTGMAVDGTDAVPADPSPADGEPLGTVDRDQRGAGDTPEQTVVAGEDGHPPVAPGVDQGGVVGSEDPLEEEAGATDGPLERADPPESVGVPEDDGDADEVTDIPIEAEVRTRTMADLLMHQEEFGQALGVYEALWRECPPGKERRDLEGAMEVARERDRETKPEENQGVETDGADRTDDKEDMINTLSALADRLEERGAG